MKPVLYREDETEFINNGLGRLDCISCIVREERNGLYELELTAPESGLHTPQLKQSMIVLAKHDDSDDLQPFRIYNVQRPMNGRVRAYARHISYQLSYIPAMPFQIYASATACAEALAGLKANAAEKCPFTFTTDVTTVASYTQSVPASIKQRLGGIKGSILDQFGGEYEWDRYNVILHKNRGVITPTVTLRYGKNIIDLMQEENIANTVTGVCPFWASIDGDDVAYLPERVVESEYASAYPFKRTIALDLSQEFEERPTDAQIRDMANIYVNRPGVGLPKVSIDVNFIQLWQTEEYKEIAPLQHVRLCDYVNIEFERLGISEQAKVVKTEYDVLNERYTAMELGEIRSSLAQTITEMNGAIEEETNRNIFALRNMSTTLRSEINGATAWLTGSNGYVMAVKNTDGSWKELLFLDSPNADEAIRVLRVNENGIGFSSSGIAGPYTQAWTLDGKIVIGGTNVPSLTVYHSDGTVLFQVTAEGLEWNLPNSTMSKAGVVTLKGAVISGSFTAESADKKTRFYAGDDGLYWSTPNGSQMSADGVATLNGAKVTGSFSAASTDGTVVFNAGDNGVTWSAPNSSMTENGTMTLRKATIGSDDDKGHSTTIANGTITTNNLQATGGSFTGTVSAGKVTGTEISGSSVRGTTITGGTVEGTNISGSTITSRGNSGYTTIQGQEIISSGDDGSYTGISAGIEISNNLTLIGQTIGNTYYYPALMFARNAQATKTKGIVFIPSGMVDDNRPILQAIGHLEVVSAENSVIGSGFIADSGRLYVGGKAWFEGTVKPATNRGADLGAIGQEWDCIFGRACMVDEVLADYVEFDSATTGTIKPMSTGTALGGANARWKIYGTTGDYSGQVSAEDFKISDGTTLTDIISRVEALERR